MRILITGADGFIAQNLQIRLRELGCHELLTFTHRDDLVTLENHVKNADFIFHLAGVNRPKSLDEFQVGNVDLTAIICQYIVNSGRIIPILLSSSTQAILNNPYGVSKYEAEKCLIAWYDKTKNPVFIYRLTNVFGKWSRPNYNSVVATFCYNTACGYPITINDPNTPLKLVYIDDVIDSFIGLLNNYSDVVEQYITIATEYDTTIGELAEIIHGFKHSIETGVTLAVGVGLIRALYSTYLSFLPKENFAYSLTRHEDPRGVFVEMLKTSDSGQFSFFTAHPGITRGGHYHHTKTEKFLVIKGTALYRFRHIVTKEYYEVTVTANEARVVETIPGWSHDITNIGDDELIVMLWANEVFDRNKPDTINFKI